MELYERFVLGNTSNRESFSPSAFQLGEKVPKADEGALVLAEKWIIFTNGRGKLMKTLNFNARTAPSSAFGTFSPRKKPRGEKDSRLRESQVVQADCEKRLRPLGTNILSVPRGCESA